jgi:hypothetical protein
MSCWRRGLKPFKEIARTALQQAEFNYDSARNAHLLAYSTWLSSRTDANHIKFLATEEKLIAARERFKELQANHDQQIRQEVVSNLCHHT